MVPEPIEDLAAEAGVGSASLEGQQAQEEEAIC